MDQKAVIARFRDQLPFRIEVLGRGVVFRKSDSGDVAVDIEEGYIDLFNSTKTRWYNRKSVQIDGPDQRANFAVMKARLKVKDSIQRFLGFFISQPIGVRLMILSKDTSFSRLVGRVSAINQAYLTWDAITNWERDAKNRLNLSIPCAGFRNRIAKHESNPIVIDTKSLSWCMCSVNSSDTSGLCGTHKKPSHRNLFNYYPFFAAEGFPELDAWQAPSE